MVNYNFIIMKIISLLFVFSLVSFAHCLSHQETIQMFRKGYYLIPEGYNIIFSYNANIERNAFSYKLITEISFTLSTEVDELVFETTVQDAEIVKLIYIGLTTNETLDTKKYGLGTFYVLQMRNGSVFPLGSYLANTEAKGQISTNNGFGIRYALHLDRMTKNWQVD